MLIREVLEALDLVGKIDKSFRSRNANNYWIRDKKKLINFNYNTRSEKLTVLMMVDGMNRFEISFMTANMSTQEIIDIIAKLI